METIFILGSILLNLISHVIGTAAEPNCFSYEAERKHGKALVGHVIKTVSLEQLECMNACNRVFKCFSTNIYRTNNGSAVCEMNKSTRDLSPASFMDKSGYEYNQITMMQMCNDDGCKNKDGKTSGPVAHWRLDGNDAGVTLRGDAAYQTDGSGGGKVLYLDGTQSYAETPAVDFTTTSFTIAFWVKVPSPGVNADIYGDWSNPHQFRLTYTASNQRVALQARNTNGRDRLHVGAGPISLDKWVHVAINWNREILKTKIFLNGKQAASANPMNSGAIDLMTPRHAVYDIGLKRDSGSAKTFKGFIKELMIFERALEDGEVEATMILSLKDMPPQMIPWQMKLYDDEKSSNE